MRGVRASLLLGLMVGCLSCLSGCEPKTKSPFSGKEVTAAELEAEASMYDARQQLAEQRASEDAAAALRKLKTGAELQARRLKTQADQDLFELQASTESDAQDAIEKVTSQTRESDIELAGMQTAINAAVADLKRQREQRALVWGAIKQIPGVSTAPGFAAADGMVTALIGTGIGAGAIQLSKRRLRKTNQELESELSATYAAAGRVVDSIDVLKTAEPMVAKAMKERARQVQEWQGVEGMELVQRLQRGAPHKRARA